MKLFLMVVIILLVSCPEVSAIEQTPPQKWSWQETAFFVSNLLVASIDFQQTIATPTLPDRNPVTNALQDTPALLAMTWGAFYLTEWYVLDRWPKLRLILPWQFGLHLSIVAENRETIRLHTGLRIPF